MLQSRCKSFTMRIYIVYTQTLSGRYLSNKCLYTFVFSISNRTMVSNDKSLNILPNSTLIGFYTFTKSFCIVAITSKHTIQAIPASSYGIRSISLHLPLTVRTHNFWCPECIDIYIICVYVICKGTSLKGYTRTKYMLFMLNKYS